MSIDIVYTSFLFCVCLSLNSPRNQYSIINFKNASILAHKIWDFYAPRYKEKIVLIYKYMQDYTIDPTSPSFNSRAPFNTGSPIKMDQDKTKKVLIVFAIIFGITFLVPGIIFGVVFFVILGPMWREGINKIESHSNGIEIPLSTTHVISKLKQNYDSSVIKIPITSLDCEELNVYVNNRAGNTKSFDICEGDKIETFITSASSDRTYIYLLDDSHIARLKTNTTYSKLYEIAIYSERKAEIVEKAKTISLSKETTVVEIPDVPQVPNVEDIIESVDPTERANDTDN